MSDLVNLNQDIDALRKEIEFLNSKKLSLEKKIEDDKNTKDEEEPLVQEFEILFNKFPELYELLSREKMKRIEDTSKRSGDEERAAPGGENKKRKDTTSHDILDDTNLPEHEWVLKKQPVIEHKIFNAEIADDIDTDILVSPSKRKQLISNSQSSEEMLQKDFEIKILKENIFRLFGISFFPVVDPSDLYLNKETNEMEIKREMIGIRFESFDERINMFDKPNYILLKKKKKTNNWAIFKYTIPSYIEIMNIFNNVNNGMLLTYNDIYIFTKQVYVELLLIENRKKHLLMLEADGIINNLTIDLNLSIIKLTTVSNNCNITLYLEKDKVTSATLYSETLPESTKNKWEITLLGPIPALSSKLMQLSNNN